jgi:hypothetical protein
VVSFGCELLAQIALAALPVGETRGSKRQGGAAGGGSPSLHGAQRRKVGETRRSGGGAAHPGGREGRSPLALTPSMPGVFRPPCRDGDGAQPPRRSARAVPFTIWLKPRT